MTLPGHMKKSKKKKGGEENAASDCCCLGLLGLSQETSALDPSSAKRHKMLGIMNCISSP